MEKATINDLNDAISFKQKKRVTDLLPFVNPNQEDEFGLTPLMIAAQMNWDEMIDLLCDWGAISNYKTMQGENALYVACKYDNFFCVLRLLQRGAYLNGKMFDGNTAIFIVVKHSSFNTYNMIISKNVDLSIVNNNGLTVLDVAERYIARSAIGERILLDLRTRVKNYTV